MPRRASLTSISPGWALLGGVVGVAVIEIAMLAVGSDVNRAIPALLLFLPVVVSGLIGGRLVALGVALPAAVGFAMVLPPFGTFRVELGHDIAALVLFVVVSVIAALLLSSVALSDRRRLAAEQDRVEALRQVDRDRAALLRSVSHDLRTPLATIRAAATDLRSFDHPVATREELLDLVIDESERLDRIVGNLLSLSRIEAGALLPDRQPVDFGELVSVSTDRLRRLTSRVHLELDVDADLPLVPVDYSQLDQVVGNLVENAVRHSPPGGSVAIAVHRSPAGVSLRVTDEGTGFDPAVRGRVFEPFASATGSGSSGIGLAICQAIVDAHGGTIAATDAASGGAEVVVELPVHA